MLEAASVAAGVGRFKVHPHTFRHSRAVYLLSKGMTLNELQKFLGHQQMETTLIYLQILPKEMVDKVEEITKNENLIQ